MPWSNQSGGGGGGWKGGGGPWGQGPGSQPPDLEDMLKRSQDRMKQVMHGGGIPGPLVFLAAAAAVAVARRNADKHGAKVELLEGDLFAPVSGRTFDVVVSNPPYIETRAKLPRDVADWEPKVALFAGERGLDVLARLCGAARDFVASPGLFACEIDPVQSEAVRSMVERAGFSAVRAVQDLSGQDRVVMGERR